VVVLNNALVIGTLKIIPPLFYCLIDDQLHLIISVLILFGSRAHPGLETVSNENPHNVVLIDNGCNRKSTWVRFENYPLSQIEMLVIAARLNEMFCFRNASCACPVNSHLTFARFSDFWRRHFPFSGSPAVSDFFRSSVSG